MPSAEYNESPIRGGNDAARTRCLAPIKNSGSLDRYDHNDLTPVIGREFFFQATDLLEADEQLMRDLAVTSKLQWYTSTVQRSLLIDISCSFRTRSRFLERPRYHSPTDAGALPTNYRSSRMCT